MKALNVHVEVHHHLLAEPAPRIRLQMERVAMSLHVALARKDLPAHVAGKLAAFPLVDFRDVNAEVFGVSEEFTADPAHKFGGGGGVGGRVGSGPAPRLF